MATTRRGWRPEDLWLLRAVSDPQPSPDGRFVAFVEGRNDRETDAVHTAIWVSPSAGDGAPRQLTFGSKDSSPRWSPDGRSIAFVSDRGSEPQLYVLPVDGGEARRLTTARHGVAQPAWSPDAMRVAYVARTGAWKEPKDRLPHERNAPTVVTDLSFRLDGVGIFDGRRQHVFVADVRTGRSRQITSGDWNDEQPGWSPDGRSIAFVSDRERGRRQRLWRADVWVVPATGGRPRKLTQSRGGAACPAFSPDGRWVAYVGHEHGDESYARNKQVLVVPADGSADPRPVTAALDRSVAGWPLPTSGSPIAWTARSDAILFTAYDRGTIPLLCVPLAGGRVAPVLAGDRQVEAFALGADGRTVAFVQSWLSSPPEVHACDVDGTGERRVSRSNDELRRTIGLAKARRITHRAADGTQIESFVLHPPRRAKRPRGVPAVLVIHGGPHGMHPMPPGFPDSQALAGAGYAVVLPNPRGSTGYGEAFTLGCVRDWGGADFDDLMGAVDALVSKGVADAGRLYVSGYSYGGFMTSWTVGHTNRFRAAVVGGPVADLVSMFGTSDIPWFSVYELGGTPWDAPEEYRKRSPLTYLPDVRTPVMLVHWDGDLRCPPEQSEQLFLGLRLLGRQVVLVRYPGGSHVRRSPSQAVDRTERVLAWYDRHGPGRTRGAERRRD